MSSPEDWVKSIEEEVEATQEAAKQRTQALAQGRDLISEQMPAIWTQLYEEFQSYCEAYNKGKKTGMLVFSLGTSYLFVVRKDGRSDALTGLYDPSTKQIKLEANNCQYADWLVPKVRLEGEGNVVLVSMRTKTTIDLTSIVRNALRELIIH